jgi:hypothetical protein
MKRKEAAKKQRRAMKPLKTFIFPALPTSSLLKPQGQAVHNMYNVQYGLSIVWNPGLYKQQGAPRRTGASTQNFLFLRTLTTNDIFARAHRPPTHKALRQRWRRGAGPIKASLDADKPTHGRGDEAQPRLREGLPSVTGPTPSASGAAAEAPAASASSFLHLLPPPPSTSSPHLRRSSRYAMAPLADAMIDAMAASFSASSAITF